MITKIFFVSKFGQTNYKGLVVIGKVVDTIVPVVTGFICFCNNGGLIIFPAKLKLLNDRVS